MIYATINFQDSYNDLYDWAYEELAKGSRIKASKIMKVAKKMERLYRIAEIQRYKKFY